jgi:NAD(P)-dependent dehydrogenase (short-subunit alcohol dehydrogenase family)
MLKRKTAIVTGASGRGMGRSIALTLAREGANVVVNYLISSDSAAAISEHMEKQGGQSLAYKADVTQQDQCKALVDATIEKFGQVDICVIGPGGGWHLETIDKLNSQAALDDVHKELAPIYNFMSLVLPGMYSRRWGRIIAISLLSSVPSPSYAYNSGKAARTNALLLAHKEAWKHGVTINVIAPGPVKELASLPDAVELCEHGPKWQERKNVTPQDIAEGVAMLCSDFGKFISGCELTYMFY